MHTHTVIINGMNKIHYKIHFQFHILNILEIF